MALVMTPIYTQTVGAGGAASVTFNNIPQVYTDLQIFVSGRSSTANSPYQDIGVYLIFNGDSGSNYSMTRLYGLGSGSGGSDRQTNATGALAGVIPASGTTTGVYGNNCIYIANYTGSNFKQVISDSVNENNATNNVIQAAASVWRSSAAITSLSISGNYVQHSTVSLYGIIRSGA